MPDQVIKVEEEDGQLQIVPAVEKLATTTRLTNLSDGHKTAPRIASVRISYVMHASFSNLLCRTLAKDHMFHVHFHFGNSSLHLCFAIGT